MDEFQKHYVSERSQTLYGLESIYLKYKNRQNYAMMTKVRIVFTFCLWGGQQIVPHKIHKRPFLGVVRMFFVLT